MNRRKFEVDTEEKAHIFYQALLIRPAHERILYIFEHYPELRQMTHERLGELIGFERETVTRTLALINGLKEIRQNQRQMRRLCRECSR